MFRSVQYSLVRPWHVKYRDFTTNLRNVSGSAQMPPVKSRVVVEGEQSFLLVYDTRDCLGPLRSELGGERLIPSLGEHSTLLMTRKPIAIGKTNDETSPYARVFNRIWYHGSLLERDVRGETARHEFARSPQMRHNPGATRALQSLVRVLPPRSTKYRSIAFTADLATNYPAYSGTNAGSKRAGASSPEPGRDLARPRQTSRCILP